MNKIILCLIFLSSFSFAQVTTDPTFPVADQEVTITVDVSDTDLAGYTDNVWLWTWIEQGATDTNAPTNVNPATDAQSDALMTRSADNGDIYTITLTLIDFFGLDAEEIEEIGLLLKGQTWDDGQTPDYSFDVLSDQFAVSFTSPSSFPLLVDASESISVSIAASEAGSLSLKVDNVEVASAIDAITLDHTLLAASDGIHEVTVEASNGEDTAEDSFSYTVRSTTVEQSRPAGIIDGINYDSDPTMATLSLLAPMKSSVYVVGDFTDWEIDPAYQMIKDDEHFWLEIVGLTSGEAYAYQYLIDEEIWIADPHADKILDTDDQWIPESTYPGLMAYPEGAAHLDWYHNRASVLQTNQTPYIWENNDFEKPEKEDLIVYELLVRDFLGEENMNYQSLIDTLGYIKDLGVNTIELMPIMEFNGNDSWGYNPTFMFAVDKAYGTKNDLKEFIDAAHGMGMAVILDMVMNQNDIPSPYAQMYFDFDDFKPTAENPWFNQEAKHPYNVFSDINHESSYTQNWLDSINHYWLNEFHFDGYRFDLSKGFTQVDNSGSVSNWGKMDPTRIALLKRMADAIWEHTPDAYVILEHFADNDEEKELSDYGMMLWGNSYHDYNEAALGFGEDKSIEWAYYEERGWTNNYLISYMESHDEERQMYQMLNFGNSSGDYSIKNFNTAIQRLKLSAAFFFTVPGPKMFWQWGEFGYDIPIDENGRTGRKPEKWEYLENSSRRELYLTYKELIKLRNEYDVFTKGDFSWSPDGVHKTIHVSNSDTSVVIVGNFDVVEGTIDPAFQHTGTWYDFISGSEVNITDANANLTLSPGEFHIYTDHALHTPEVGLVTSVSQSDLNEKLIFYPNPTADYLNINLTKLSPGQFNQDWTISNILGQEVLKGSIKPTDEVSLNVTTLPRGIYTFRLPQGNQIITKKFIKN
ncbi:Por secretion system C-terminal sorting domain-containing protein [Reichenbachiella faecimaris]|uniref:Por secretion system C-terminal sorting domain-containing protein n=1 Tax=Reichenbachiella faecimaris TaxID=692418 RepID=A0A1W2GLX0_REIFA|nr:alpha-amylase family glycosyl hydrolase [Reichenbachiella faecimaris]SMD37276.1 Por secretion system C-terminal sorting domain-containing protein [Reichenbachiella faecimaris]